MTAKTPGPINDAGAEAAQRMMPLTLEGPVVRGFGRGSRLLGFPTANIPPEPYEALLADLPLGVYYGWAVVSAPGLLPPHGDTPHMMAMSIGLNPSFRNEAKTIEVHLLHQFDTDFYGANLKATVIGYLRPMMQFGSLAELKQAIQSDCEHAREALARCLPPVPS